MKKRNLLKRKPQVLYLRIMETNKYFKQNSAID